MTKSCHYQGIFCSRALEQGSRIWSTPANLATVSQCFLFCDIACLIAALQRYSKHQFCAGRLQSGKSKYRTGKKNPTAKEQKHHGSGILPWLVLLCGLFIWQGRGRPCFQNVCNATLGLLSECLSIPSIQVGYGILLRFIYVSTHPHLQSKIFIEHQWCVSFCVPEIQQ